MNISKIYTSTIENLFEELQSSERGLSATEADARRKQNQTQGKRFHLFTRAAGLLLKQFANPLVLLLAVAVILSWMLGEYTDGTIILIILLLSGLMGFWQEYHANRAVGKLRRMIELKYTVLREGATTEITIDGIVAGDILLFDAGDMVPADCRIIESRELHVNESSLTGESLPAEKYAGTIAGDVPLGERHNCIWQGTNIISGTATAIAVNTNADTIFGSMAQALERSPETAYERGIRHFGFFLLYTTLVLSVVILAANLYFHKPLLDSILFSLALAVGMAPELLPAIMTLAMSAGAGRLLRKKVIVKKLSSVFSFGEVNVLCTDKTGTITEGNVILKDIVAMDGTTNDRIRLYAFLNASMQNGFVNPIDKSIAALKIAAAGFTKTDELPYDFMRKRLTISVCQPKGCILIMKGALASVLETCTYLETGGIKTAVTPEWRGQIMERFVAYSRQGLRVLGLAYKETNAKRVARSDESNMVFLGFILLEDPLKDSALSSVRRLGELGLTVKIITGDNRFAALHTAEKLGLENGGIITGQELAALSAEALVVKVRTIHLFAEIEPQQKESIIKALQKAHFAVAYIGDGINDVSAINAADVGISTNDAVDVAKEAADFVLLDKDLSVLADGITEGRRSFANCMKYILITTGATFGNMFSVAGASLLLPFLPMLPKQILLTNLVTDFPFLTIASDSVDGEQLKRPGKWDLKMLRSFMVVMGLHSSLFDLLTFYILYACFHLSGSAFRTGWFLESVMTEFLIVFIIRTQKSFIRSRPGKLLLMASLFAVCITFYLPFSPVAEVLGLTPPGVYQLITIGIILLVYLVSGDLLKKYFFRQHKGHPRLRQPH